MLEDGKEDEIGQKEDTTNHELANLDIRKVLKHKRYHYMLTSLLSIALFLILLEFSYTEVFKINLFMFLVVLFFVEACFTYFLQNIILKENLLIQPISAALETIQFVMFMAAYNFQFFIFSYLVRMALVIFFRTYIDPILKNLELHWGKFARWASAKNPRLKPYFANYFKSDQDYDNIA